MLGRQYNSILSGCLPRRRGLRLDTYHEPESHQHNFERLGSRLGVRRASISLSKLHYLEFLLEYIAAADIYTLLVQLISEAVLT